jgi:hypothetical protein
MAGKKKTSLPLEKYTRDAVASFMRSSGFVVQTEVKVPTGRIDCLVREYLPSGGICWHIIECKRRNDSSSLKSAISQLRHYAMHYNKERTKLYFCTSDKSQLSEESKRIMQANPDILYKVF